jgi:hypothetical protein
VREGKDKETETATIDVFSYDKLLVTNTHKNASFNPAQRKKE